MYRTFTSSSGTCGYLLVGGRLCDRVDEKADASAQLGGAALERRQGVLVGAGLAGRVRDAPVDLLGAAGELGADLAYAVAQADHVVEALGRELVEVLGSAPGQVDAAVAHHSHGVGVQRLWVAARARRAHGAAGELLGEGLGHLRARAVARAQEQHPRL